MWCAAIARSDSARLGGLAIVGSPLYAAGLDLGDEIVAIGDTKVPSLGDIDKALASRQAGRRGDDCVHALRRREESHRAADRGSAC